MCRACHGMSHGVSHAAGCSADDGAYCVGPGLGDCRCSAPSFFDPAMPGVCSACDPRCGDGGCTGPSNQDCTVCPAVSVDGGCEQQCPDDRYSTGHGICHRCHQGCGAAGCSGPGSRGCNLNRCPDPSGWYFDRGAGSCRECSSTCTEQGCTGPRPSDCASCRGPSHAGDCVEECPTGYFSAAGPGGDPAQALCTRCDRSCADEGCSHAGPDGCHRCATGIRDVATGRCVSECPLGRYNASADLRAELLSTGAAVACGNFDIIHDSSLTHPCGKFDMT